MVRQLQNREYLKPQLEIGRDSMMNLRRTKAGMQKNLLTSAWIDISLGQRKVHHDLKSKGNRRFTPH